MPPRLSSLHSPKELLHNECFGVTLDERLGLIRVTRSGTAMGDAADVEDQHQRISAFLDLIGRRGRTLLIDLRAAPGRNDPEFEAVMSVQRPRLFGGFRRAAALVRTAVGALQVKRHTREDGTDVLVSSDEHEILSYLLS